MKILARLSILSLALLFLITLTGCPPDDSAADADAEALNGTWTLDYDLVVPSDDGNFVYDPIEIFSLTFTATDLKYKVSGRGDIGRFFHNTTTNASNGTFTYDASTKVITFTETGHDDSEGNPSGKTFPSFTVMVISVEGNTLEIEARPLESRGRVSGIVDPWEMTFNKQ